MKYFLEHVAQQLYSEYGDKLGRQCLVFPGRRAGVFMLKHLAAAAGRALWAPAILTINDLFATCSRLRLASPEALVLELFRIYKKISGSNEALDSFYFWGEMLINDFDETDKYLADAQALFTNITDLYNIDEKFGSLTEEQTELIRQFIKNFRAGSASPEKRDFEFIWSLLYPLYKQYNETLVKKGLAYEGMIFRSAVSSLPHLPVDISGRWENFHFIGFNALNSCEAMLMKHLKQEGRAFFYWDYLHGDHYSEYPDSLFFVKRNITDFGQDLHDRLPDEDKNTSDRTIDDKQAVYESAGVKKPDISITDVPSDSAQAKLLPHLLGEMNVTADSQQVDNTAIILADENLLPAVMTSIPPSVADINITMGYPFSLTVVYSLVKALLDLQETPFRHGRSWMVDYRKVMPVLTNPLINRLAGKEAMDAVKHITGKKLVMLPADYFSPSPFLTSLFEIQRGAGEVLSYLRTVIFTIAAALKEAEKESDDKGRTDKLTPEFLFHAITALNRLEVFIDDKEIMTGKSLFLRLADKVLREVRIAFRGEPLKGLQIMGMLESRALDFDNIIVLSANEGVLPRNAPLSSYIPWSLREAFGLPTIAYNDSVYAYYFSRLLGRARKVAFVYNSSAEGLRSGEMSRFLLRLKYSNRMCPSFSSAGMNISQRPDIPEYHERTPEDVGALTNLYLSGPASLALSPSAVNTWLNCRMKFYYSYVCGLREPDRLTRSIDPAVLGSALHELVAGIYEPYRGRVVDKEIIDDIRKKQAVDSSLVEEVMRAVMYGGSMIPLCGTGLISSDILSFFLKRVLDIDRSQAPFTIISLEDRYEADRHVEVNGVRKDFRLGGKIDRIDEREGVRRLIDYKTGKAKSEIKTLDQLFSYEAGDLNDAAMQTMIYCLVMEGKSGYERLRPVIYRLRADEGEEFRDYLTIGKEPLDDFSAVSDEFSELLDNTISDIFNPDIPFIMTSDKNRCQFCPYKNLCQR